MNPENAPVDDEPILEPEDIFLIADQFVHWSRKQAEAFRQKPLMYISYLLDCIAEAEYVAWEDIPEEVGKLVPYLKPDACLALVGIYLDRRTALG